LEKGRQSLFGKQPVIVSSRKQSDKKEIFLKTGLVV
jgi:hypothetical protein